MHDSSTHQLVYASLEVFIKQARHADENLASTTLQPIISYFDEPIHNNFNGPNKKLHPTDSTRLQASNETYPQQGRMTLIR